LKESLYDQQGPVFSAITCKCQQWLLFDFLTLTLTLTSDKDKDDPHLCLPAPLAALRAKQVAIPLADS